MKQILLLSRVNTRNLGDQAIGRSMLSLFSPLGEVVQGDICDMSIDKKIQISDYDLNSTQKNMSIKSTKKITVNRNSLKNKLCFITNSSYLKNMRWLKANCGIYKILLKKRFDLIVFGGGELINPSFAYPLKLWSILIRLFQSKAVVVLFGIGVTDCADERKKRKLSSLIKIASQVFVRDDLSKQNMVEFYGIEAVEIPDVVYANKFFYSNDRKYTLYGMTTIDRIRNHNKLFSCEKEYFDASYREVLQLSENGNVKLFYTTQDDYEACVKFAYYCMHNYNFLIEIAKVRTLDDLITILKGSSVVYSPRMHGCILAQLRGAEVHPILISKKMDSYYNKYMNGFNLTEARDTLLKAVNTI